MKKIRITSIVLLFIVAANALLAGYSFMTEPGGQGLKAPVSLLRFSPFRDFFIPGLILFTVNGVCCVIAGVMLIAKWRYAYQALAVQGVLLCGWIFIQVILLREFNLLHFIFGGLGLFFFLAGLRLSHTPGSGR